MNPYAPPQAHAPAPYYAQAGQGAFQAWMEGDTLVVQKEAPLPDCCMKCGSNQIALRRNHLFTFTPQWVFFLFLVSGLIAIIVAMILQKKGRLQVPLCANCARRWTQGLWLVALGVIWLIVGLILGGIAAANDLPELGIPLMISAVVGIVVVGITNRNRFLRAKKIDEQFISLALVNPIAAQTIVAASQGRY